jgi:hypothetical protein
LRREALTQGISLNALCETRLALPDSIPHLHPDLEPLIRHTKEVLGTHLAGVVVYGSWARGEAADGSDIDVLIVLEPAVRLSRKLYRQWDDSPISCKGRGVEIHLARFPDPERVAGGLWAEIALDGIVVFDPSLRLSLALVRIRRQIASGKLVQRMSHGQPYWTTGEVA